MFKLSAYAPVKLHTSNIILLMQFCLICIVYCITLSITWVLYVGVTGVFSRVLKMVRSAKRPHHMRSCRFTFVRDPTLRKVDSNTRKIHSQ